MLKLMTHLNPFALATRIADCRLTDLERKPVNWNERSVSQLNFGSAISSGEEENSPLSTNVGRLDKISAESQLLEYRLERQEGVRNFPVARLLWTRTNIQRLMELVQAGIASLPTNSFNYELAIKLKCGALGPKMPWPTLAKTMSAAGGPQFTEKQMRYAIEKAMDHIRVYIMRHLTPDLGEVTDRKLLKTQRFK